MCHLNFRRQRIRVDREAVVLRGDGNLSGSQIFHWLVCAAMSEFQFESSAAKCVAEHLMTETNPEDRLLAHQVAHCVMCISEGRRVAGTVRKKNTVWIERQHIGCARRSRNDRDRKSILPQL